MNSITMATKAVRAS